ncbi:MAG: DHA2 family efflux MFS transporter permease subunit [Proteobacteria bacterium]|nr:DHA2 family efflux MFS transporter permease subunit [Pseudomonadota bacterium]
MNWLRLAFITLAAMLGTFMEVLDTTIANVAIPHIAGNLSVSTDESTWVITSYLVANAVILPITPWLAGIIGRKRLFMLCVLTFTASSFLCGIAPNLETLIIARILQGLGGGGLQPIEQAILLEAYPPDKRGLAMAFYGLVVVIAPVLGPIVGGWITDNYSWRWSFFINLPIGALSFILIYLFIEDPPYLKRIKTSFDFIGLFLLALFLGTLQFILDKGEREDWFQSDLIIYFSIICVIAGSFFFIWERQEKEPVVDLSLLKNWNFTLSIIFITVLGVVLYGSITLVPVMLQNLAGYDAFTAGLVLGTGGIGGFISMFLTARLITRIDGKYLIMLGVGLHFISMILMSSLNLSASFIEYCIPRFIQGLSLGFLFIPISVASVAYLPKEKIGSATGIYNLMRNIGGSIGIAMVMTLLNRRAQFHQTMLVDNLHSLNNNFNYNINKLTFFLKQKIINIPGYEKLLSYNLLGLEVQRQAYLKSFLDNFYLFSFLTLIIGFAFLLKKIPKDKEISLH